MKARRSNKSIRFELGVSDICSLNFALGTHAALSRSTRRPSTEKSADATEPRKSRRPSQDTL